MNSGLVTHNDRIGDFAHTLLHHSCFADQSWIKSHCNFAAWTDHQYDHMYRKRLIEHWGPLQHIQVHHIKTCSAVVLLAGEVSRGGRLSYVLPCIKKSAILLKGSTNWQQPAKQPWARCSNNKWSSYKLQLSEASPQCGASGLKSTFLFFNLTISKYIKLQKSSYSDLYWLEVEVNSGLTIWILIWSYLTITTPMMSQEGGNYTESSRVREFNLSISFTLCHVTLMTHNIWVTSVSNSDSTWYVSTHDNY